MQAGFFIKNRANNFCGSALTLNRDKQDWKARTADIYRCDGLSRIIRVDPSHLCISAVPAVSVSTALILLLGYDQSAAQSHELAVGVDHVNIAEALSRR